MVKKKVMIVDDSPMMRLIIQSMLSDDPSLRLVGTASNGREALDKLPTLEPDLILLDIEMPEMSGLDFLRKARAQTQAKVIVLSSLADEASKEALALGADAVISKPSGSVSYDLKARRGSEARQTIYRLLELRDE
jgi:two-component system, chemotaxis family, protein-glutamate methylesterase/glutaminase